MIAYPGLIVCTTCGAVTARQTIDDHHQWHREHGHQPVGVPREELPPARRPWAEYAETQRLPPITDTVRRRPPPPVVRELSERVELLRALVQELADYDEDGQ